MELLLIIRERPYQSLNRIIIVYSFHAFYVCVWEPFNRLKRTNIWMIMPALVLWKPIWSNRLIKSPFSKSTIPVWNLPDTLKRCPNKNYYAACVYSTVFYFLSNKSIIYAQLQNWFGYIETEKKLWNASFKRIFIQRTINAIIRDCKSVHFSTTRMVLLQFSWTVFDKSLL